MNWPLGLTIFTALFLLFALYSAVRTLFQWEGPAGPLYLLLIFTLFYFETGRFWLSPNVRFDGTGIYIKKFGEAVLFIPFSNVTRLKGIYGFILDHRSSYRRFSLFYKDVYGVEHKIKIMLQYHQSLIESKPVLFEFLKLVKSANKDFVYDNSAVGRARH